MPARSILKQFRMSHASEPSSQPLLTSIFLDSRSSHAALAQSLLELRRCEAIYSGDIDAATATITYSVVKNLGTTNCQIWLYTNDCLCLKPQAHYGTVTASHDPKPLNVADHTSYFDQLHQRQWLVINSTALAIPDNNGRDSLPPYVSKNKNSITALLEVPIYRRGEIVGVLCCEQYYSPRVWQAAEKSFLVSAALLIDLALSYVDQNRKNQTLSKQKRQLSLAIIERQQAENAWQESQRFIQGILDASSNILYVNDFASGTNYYVNGYMESILGYKPDEIRQLGAQFIEKLALAEDVAAIHLARQKLAQASSGDIIETEYRLRHKLGQWRWLLCRETIFAWNQDGTPSQLLGTATDITVHKENAEALQEQNEKLTALAMVDGLTQIANRRAFDEFLHDAWIARNRAPLTLILCDIDYFKRYNDTYGHQRGDECLKLVAQALKKAVKRQPDLVARYGGEEFAVVLPNTALGGAQHVAQAIQSTVRDLEIEHSLSEASNYLTLSLGIATVDSTATGSPRTLIAAADQGLYRAKAEGRDRFAVGYPDLIESRNSAGEEA